jgi:3D (Asp-Asp-Asp) domain-containing protein
MTRDRLTGAVATALSSGLGYLADLLSRIVNGIKGIAPLVLGVACQSGATEPTVPVAQVTVSEVETEVSVQTVEPPAEEEEPKPLGQFSITFYYVIGEEEVASKSVAKEPANDNTDLAAIQNDKVTLYSGKCEPISEVSREFALQLEIQGTGKLRDGRVLNVWGRCTCEHSPCFKVTEAQWGTGGSGRALQPFRTVAVDPKVIKLGTLLYVPLLEGRMMPGRAPWGGFVHDGCVVADDVGGGIKDNQLDLFVGRKGWFLGMSGSGGSHAWARHVPVYDGGKMCERNGRKVGRKAGAI